MFALVHVFDRSIRSCQFMWMSNIETFNGSRINHFIFFILTLIFVAERVFYLIFVCASVSAVAAVINDFTS